MQIGFIGLGNMGGPMAERLAGSGGDVLAFDIDGAALQRVVEAGAEPATSVETLARRSDAVLASLPSIAVSAEVAQAVADVAADDDRPRIFVEMSTIGKQAAQAQSALLSGAGITMLDAPVSGGGEAARRGSLTIMASGPSGVGSQGDDGRVECELRARRRQPVCRTRGALGTLSGRRFDGDCL